jgi:Domain of unknown function (DUF397)
VTDHATPSQWRKSSSSETDGCVEVRMDATGVWVRDSFDLQVPPLHFTYREWRAFVEGVKGGEFDPGDAA